MTKSKAILLFLFGSNLMASDLVLSEAKVIEMALGRNQKNAISKAELEKAQLSLSKAYSSLFPTLSISGSVLKSSATGSIQPYSDDWSESASLQVTQPLYTFGKISNAIDIAKNAKSLQKNNSKATEEEIKQTAKKLYYAVLFNKEYLRISKESFQNALVNKQTLEKRVSFGRISRNDNLKMQADLASRRPTVVEAENSLHASEDELVDFLDLEPGTQVKLPEELNVIGGFNKVNVSDVKYDNLLNVKLLQDNLKVTESAVELAKSQRYPTLAAFASYAPTTYRKDLGDEPIKEMETAKVGISLSFDWPTGNSLNNEVAIKKTEQKIAQYKLDEGRRRAETQYRILLRRYESLAEKMKAEQDAVKLAEASYKVALGAYSTGAVSQLQLNDSEILLTRNKLSLANTKLSILNTIADIERLIAKGNVSEEEGA